MFDLGKKMFLINFNYHNNFCDISILMFQESYRDFHRAMI